MVSYYMICRDCRRSFEVATECLLKDEDRVCPHCGSARVRQRLSGILRNLDVAAFEGEKLRSKKCA